MGGGDGRLAEPGRARARGRDGRRAAVNERMELGFWRRVCWGRSEEGERKREI